MGFFFEDRYNGAYCGGKWVCVSDNKLELFVRCYEYSCQDDVTAMNFWHGYYEGGLQPDEAKHVSVGDTPELAREALYNKWTQENQID